MIRMGEANLGVKCLGDAIVVSELLTVVVRDRVHLVLVGHEQLFGGLSDLFGALAGYARCKGQPCCALDKGH